MGGPGPVSRLAARFRKAVEDREAARQSAQELARKAAVDAQQARLELFRDLSALAKEIGGLQVGPDGEGITIRSGDRYLHLAPQGDHDRVSIEFEGMGDEEHSLYRQAELGHRWVYSRKRRFREDRIPLFDAGLEELLVHGLGLPRPSDDPPPDPAPRSETKKRL